MVTDGNYNKGGGKRDNLNMTIGNAHAAASNDYQDVSIYQIYERKSKQQDEKSVNFSMFVRRGASVSRDLMLLRSRMQQKRV